MSLINEYDYLLPKEKIAYNPLSNRDLSKLLVYEEGIISDTLFQNVAHYLPANSLMVRNNTRVFPARINFHIQDKLVEIFCLQPISELIDFQNALQNKSPVRWKCLIGNARSWKPQSILTFSDESITLHIKYLKKVGDYFELEFEWQPKDLSFLEVLNLVGKTPLPPYIKRAENENDKKRYQTIYAKNIGSVAAPTAGLHFTESILQQLHKQNITIAELTLHIGAGTFKPITTQNIEEHIMHPEPFSIPISLIELLLENDFVTAIGTTTLRTLESLYWCGVQSLEIKNIDNQFYIKQFPYLEYNKPLPNKKEVLDRILTYLKERNLNELRGITQLYILPNYRFQFAKELITNFHQPKSTLLLLIAAFVGEGWRKIYAHALENDYRFLSFGDGSLLFRKGFEV